MASYRSSSFCSIHQFGYEMNVGSQLVILLIFGRVQWLNFILIVIVWKEWLLTLAYYKVTLMVLKLANLCEWHLITATMMQLGGYVKVDICFRTRELKNLKVVINLIHMFTIQVKSFYNKSKSRLLFGGSFVGWSYFEILRIYMYLKRKVQTSAVAISTSWILFPLISAAEVLCTTIGTAGGAW